MIFHPHFCASLYVPLLAAHRFPSTKRSNINSTEFYYPELFSNFCPRKCRLVVVFYQVDGRATTKYMFLTSSSATNILSFSTASRCLFSNSIIPPFSVAANRVERMIKLVEDGRGSALVLVSEKERRIVIVIDELCCVLFYIQPAVHLSF